jgi:tetraacyldisaccharide 4'-kinase
MVAGARDTVVVPSASRVFVVTGIARPDRFAADISSVGWDIAGMMEFRDHHPFSAGDVKRIAAAAHAAGSAIVLTTEKDAVRLAACDLGDLPVAAVPLHVGVEPADGFRDWLLDRLKSSRQSSDDGHQS